MNTDKLLIAITWIEGEIINAKKIKAEWRETYFTEIKEKLISLIVEGKEEQKEKMVICGLCHSPIHVKDYGGEQKDIGSFHSNCFLLLEANKVIEQFKGKPEKSIEDCKLEVAKKHGYKYWHDLQNVERAKSNEFIDEAMQLYFEQGKPAPSENDAVEFTRWISQSDWQFSRDEENSFDKRAGRLIHGRVLETKTTKELYKLFKDEKSTQK